MEAALLKIKMAQGELQKVQTVCQPAITMNNLCDKVCNLIFDFAFGLRLYVEKSSRIRLSRCRSKFSHKGARLRLHFMFTVCVSTILHTPISYAVELHDVVEI